MQRTIIVLHHKPLDYSVSGPIRFFIRLFNDEYYKRILLEKYNLKVISSLDIENTYKQTNREFLKYIKNKKLFSNSIVLGIHPAGFSRVNKILGPDTKIKTILWQDDLHFFANFAPDNQTSNQKYVGKFTCFLLDTVSYIITPSFVYMKNLELSEYYHKTVDIFYCLDPIWFEKLKDKQYKERTDRIILSGAIGGGYKSRIEFDNLRIESKDFGGLIFKLEHPGRKNKHLDMKNNLNMVEMNYYEKLSEFKGAFVGHHEFPINFCLAKHIEILMCGCLGFYEPNPLLKSQLGLKAFEHYVPCYKDGKLIDDIEFYKKWMNSEEGEKIASTGQKYVMENFGNKQIEKLFSFLQNCL